MRKISIKMRELRRVILAKTKLSRMVVPWSAQQYDAAQKSIRDTAYASSFRKHGQIIIINWNNRRNKELVLLLV